MKVEEHTKNGKIKVDWSDQVSPIKKKICSSCHKEKIEFIDDVCLKCYKENKAK